MKLSTKSRYGSRILMDLARFQDQGPVSIGDISKRQSISVKYLEQLIRPLKKAGLVTSVRGPKGGHMLSKRPEKITLGQSVRLFEKNINILECINSPESCSMSSGCRIRLAWRDAESAFYDKLDSYTIADLIK